MAKKDDLHPALELSPDQALFGAAPGKDPSIDGIVAVIYENERPLRGLAGLLDWRFHGAISKALQAGALSGKTGECAYLPQKTASRLCHLILIGAGVAPASGADTKPKLDKKTDEILRKNLKSLRIERMGVSLSDLNLNFSTSEWRTIPLRILP